MTRRLPVTDEALGLYPGTVALREIASGVRYEQRGASHWVVAPVCEIRVTDGVSSRSLMGNGPTPKRAMIELWEQVRKARGPRWLEIDGASGTFTATWSDRRGWAMPGMEEETA